MQIPLLAIHNLHGRAFRIDQCQVFVYASESGTGFDFAGLISRSGPA